MQLVQASPGLIICVWNSQFFSKKINKVCTIGTPDFLFWTRQYFIPTRISEQVGLFLLYIQKCIFLLVQIYKFWTCSTCAIFLPLQSWNIVTKCLTLTLWSYFRHNISSHRNKYYILLYDCKYFFYLDWLKAWIFFLIEHYEYSLSLQFPQRLILIILKEPLERYINLMWR